jgi:hypothetical protein
MRNYLRFLAICYAAGAVLHLMDIFDLRGEFSQMNMVWKSWILYLLAFDSAASVGLWLQKNWGIALFIGIAISQLVAYVAFKSIFGEQTFLIIFHILTLSIYLLLRLQSRRQVNALNDQRDG